MINSEDAVSESIGTILAVAITVALAAIIAVFVFGMANEMQDTYVVGVSAKFVDEEIRITYHGGPDHDKLQRLDWRIFNSTGAKYNGSPTDKWLQNPKVGDTFGTEGHSTANPFGPGTYRVQVIASFPDNAQQLMLDTYLDHT
ncbi:MAG TPA: type IV pilin [Methanoculleus sp.]|nr:type IV pilin [Methanoculleus sp.]